MTAAADGFSAPARLTCAVVLGGVATIGVWRGVTMEQPPQAAAPPASSTHATPVRTHRAQDTASAAQPAPAETTKTSTPTDASNDLSLKLDINSATPGELEMLPRIGPVLAGRITADRTANGPFRSLADLQRVSGIGPKTAQALEPYIRFE